MSKVINFPNEQFIREQAGLWIARIDRGLNPAEQNELCGWLAQDSRHRATLFEMAEIWDRMEVLGEIAELFPLQQSYPRVSGAYWRPVALGTLALLVCMVIGEWLLRPERAAPGDALLASAAIQDNFSADYHTRIGEQRTFTLRDGSVLVLNTDTELQVRYTNAERRVLLLRGEAHFEVARNSERPFFVRVDDNEFRAVGTAFNVRVNTGREIELTVTEGRVKVSVAPPAEAARIGRVAPEQVTEIMVDAGKEVIIDHATQVVERLPPEKLAAAVAWTQGMIVFNGEPLEQVVLEVGRYSTLNIVIADERLKRIPVSGYFKVGDLDGLMAVLRTGFDIEASARDEAIVLSSAHRN